MVDVSPKPDTVRQAKASGRVMMQPETLQMVKLQQLKKGDVLSAARIAGIMAAKKAHELIPLCHPLLLDQVTVDFEFSGEDTINIASSVRCTGKTGVEMEALTSVAVAALTIYDMCKAVDRGMIIDQVCLQTKAGGKSGFYSRKGET